MDKLFKAGSCGIAQGHDPQVDFDEKQTVPLEIVQFLKKPTNAKKNH